MKNCASLKMQVGNQSENQLKNVKTKLRILRNEKTYLSNRKSLSPVSNDPFSLELQIKDQQRYLLNLEKENKRLNKNCSFSVVTEIQKSSTDGECVREITRYKKLIDIAQEKERINENKIKEYQSRNVGLEDDLKMYQGLGLTLENPKEDSVELAYKTLKKNLNLITAA